MQENDMSIPVRRNMINNSKVIFEQSLEKIQETNARIIYNKDQFEKMKLLYPENQEEEKFENQLITIKTKKADVHDLVPVEPEIYESRNKMMKECRSLTV